MAHDLMALVIAIAVLFFIFSMPTKAQWVPREWQQRGEQTALQRQNPYAWQQMELQQMQRQHEENIAKARNQTNSGKH